MTEAQGAASPGGMRGRSLGNGRRLPRTALRPDSLLVRKDVEEARGVSGSQQPSG